MGSLVYITNGINSSHVLLLVQVFGPESKQCELYEQAVVPIVHEVLEGFNCTIFAYGQVSNWQEWSVAIK